MGPGHDPLLAGRSRLRSSEELTLCCDSADGPAAGASEIVIHCSEHAHFLMKLQPGKPVWISLPPDKLHVLVPVSVDGTAG